MSKASNEFKSVPYLQEVGMTEEVTFYDDELTELIRTIEDGVDSLGRKRQNTKTEAIRDLEEKMKRAKQLLHSFKVEMRELSREHHSLFETKYKDHQTKLQALSGDLQIARGEADRQNLGVRNIDEMAAPEIIEVASKTQDASLASVNRMKQRLAETKQVGAETADKLRSQTEQLKNIDVDIMKVKTNLNRADILIRAFVRKMMTDKIIMVLVCLIFVGITGIIIYKAVNPDAGKEDTTSPDNTWNNQVYSANQNSRSLQQVQSITSKPHRMDQKSASNLIEALTKLLADMNYGH